MWQGEVAAIFLAPAARGATIAVETVRAIAGRGLEGDRYFDRRGTYSRLPGSGRQVTLIESEAVEALAAEYGVSLTPGESRRNLVTRGVPLNHLVGREFRVGPVLLRGTRLCEPCLHLERLTARKGTRRGLVHRGGLRADILSDGMISVGDSIQPA
jgi:MOSC domain-containing protein YiiM